MAITSGPVVDDVPIRNNNYQLHSVILLDFPASHPRAARGVLLITKCWPCMVSIPSTQQMPIQFDALKVFLGKTW